MGVAMTDSDSTMSIDARSGVPFYRQIIDNILLRIAARDLKQGDRLPTVRQLAIDIKVNPNTVSRAYRELEIRKLIVTQRGTGSFVAAESNTLATAATRLKYLDAFCDAVVADAGRNGFSLQEVSDALIHRLSNRR